jgi:hypothetical protein
MRMERSPKPLWFDELQYLNQILQAENVGLKTSLHIVEEDNQMLQEKLQSMKMQAREGYMNETVIRPFCDHGNFTNYGFEHDNENACTLCQVSEDDIQSYRNQRGFLEASSTGPSHQEQLGTSREADQESQFGMEVNKSCEVPFLINVDDSFKFLEQHASCIGLKLMGKMGYRGGGLGDNGQGIVDHIEVVVWTRYDGIGYAPKDVGESSKTIQEEDSEIVTKTLELNSSSRDEIDSMQTERTTSHDRGFETSPVRDEHHNERDEANSSFYYDSRGNSPSYKKSRKSEIPFDYKHVNNIK